MRMASVRRAMRRVVACAVGVWCVSASAQMQLPGTFAVNETGAATYTIPLSLPPGVGGVEPKLELVYNSQRGNGPLGVGWALSGLSAITRCPQTLAQDGVRGAVNFDASDRFCLDGQRLTLTSGTYGFKGARYSTEVESFKRVLHAGPVTDGDVVGPVVFVVETKEGLTMYYGGTDDSRLQVFGKTTNVAWLLSRVQDRVGNFYEVTYVKDTVNGVAYPSRINYTGNGITGLPAASSVYFDYGTRGDGTAAYHAGSRLGGPTQRLAKIRTETDSGNRQVMEYRLAYGDSPSTGRSRLESILMCTWRGDCLPAATFEWTDADSNVVATNGATPAWINEPFVKRHFGDFNGDGRTDVLARKNGWDAPRLLTSAGDGTWQAVSVPRLAGLNCCEEQKVNHERHRVAVLEGDFNGDGIQDIVSFNQLEQDKWHFDPSTLKEVVDAIIYKGNLNTHLSGRDGNWRSSSMQLPWGSAYIQTMNMSVGDFDGDGRADLLFRGMNPGDKLHVLFSNGDGTWRDVEVAPPAGADGWLNNKSNTVQAGDFNGDGKTDLTITVPGATSTPVLLSNGDGTWKVANFATPTWAHDGAQAVPGDFNGDGKTDLFYGPNMLLARGDGSWAPTLGTYPSGTEAVLQTGRCSVGDFNGDGQHDLAFGCAATADTLTFFFSTGAGRWKTITSDKGDASTTGSERFAGDFNGDGRADIAIFKTGATIVPIIFGTSQNGDQIKKFRPGYGPSTQVLAASLAQGSFYSRGAVVTLPQVVLTPAMQVVHQVMTEDGIGGFRTVRYSYDSAIAELGTGRGFMGFDAVMSRDDDLDIDTTTKYRTDWPFTGRQRLHRVTKGLGSGGLPIAVSAMSAQFTCQNPATAPAIVTPGGGAAAVAPGQPGNCGFTPGSRYQIWASRTFESGQDLNAARLFSRTTEVSDMDKFGNPGTVRVDTFNPDGSISGNVQWTSTWYSNDESLWLLGLPIRRSVTVTKP